MAHEVLANALTRIDKMYEELKSLADKVVKSGVCNTSRTEPWHKTKIHNLSDRPSMARLGVVFRRSAPEGNYIGEPIPEPNNSRLVM